MSTYKRTVGNSVDNDSGRIERDGTYHLIVQEFDAAPHDYQGNADTGFHVVAQVLAGTAQVNGVCPEAGKTIRMKFPDKDNTTPDWRQERDQKRQDRFFVATGFISEANIGQEMEVDIEDVVGRQFIAKFKDGWLSRCDLWHVDDSQVVDVPKDKKRLKMIPKALRMTPQETYTESTKKKQEAVSLDDI